MQLHEEVELSALGMGKSSLAEAYFCISLGLCYVTLAMICRMHLRMNVDDLLYCDGYLSACP